MPTVSSLKELKKGAVIIFKDAPHQVLDSEFLRMQSAKPVMKTKMRNLISGVIIAHNFSHGDKPELIDLSKKSANYLYKEKNNFIFMDNESYEQISLSQETLADKINFLSANLPVSLLYWHDQIISVEIPPKVDLEVTASEPGVRGDTAQGSGTKPATLETGYVIQVPIFVKTGDKIRVNTSTGAYVERVN